MQVGQAADCRLRGYELFEKYTDLFPPLINTPFLGFPTLFPNTAPWPNRLQLRICVLIQPRQPM